MKEILFQFPELANVYCLFQGIPENSSAKNKAWGNPEESRVLRNELLEKYAHLGLEAIASVHQVHGVDVVRKPKPMECGDPPQADGMCDDRPGLGLLIKTADCQPLLLAHASGKYVMAIHSGWRANRAGFPKLAVEYFCAAYDILPADIFAVRGPSLCPRCSEFVNYEAEWGPDFEKWHDPESGCVNLWQMTRDQLCEAGLEESRIFGIDLCTAENADQLFSYRKNRNCGRQASIIWRAR